MDSIYISSEELAGITESFSTWLGLDERTQFEHDSVLLRLPQGALRWPANFYQNLDNQEYKGSLIVEVSGLTLHLLFTISHHTNLVLIRKQEKLRRGDDPHTEVTIEGLFFTPKTLRGLIVWVIQTLRPLQFTVETI